MLRETSSKRVRERSFADSDRVSISGQAYAGLAEAASFGSRLLRFGKKDDGESVR